MTTRSNRQFVLVRRPVGELKDSDLELREAPLGPLGRGEIRARTRWLSVDPTNRIWMSDMPQYMPPVALGAVMRGIGIAEVEASEHPAFPVGSLVRGLVGWQDFVCGDPTALGLAPLRPDPEVALSAYLGALGSSGGLTAYFGLLEVGQAKAGETVLVSAAAGSVGSIAGQIAKIHGCRAVGVAGGPEKCRYVVEALGFDACVDYRAGDLEGAIARACPGGIDVDFENVGGAVLDAALANLNLRARVVLCGLISAYDAVSPPPGPRHFEQVLMRRARIEGFIVSDFIPRYGAATAALTGWLKAGRLRTQETVLEGLGALPEALRRVLRGDKVGKVLVLVSR